MQTNKDLPTAIVAGGTGGIGRTIVEELVRQGKYNVVVFSRTPAAALTGTTGVAVDYNDTAALKSILKEHHASVVISALGLFSQESSNAQMNLIRASIESGTVKTFIPSEFGIRYTEEMLSYHPAAQWWLDAADLLRSSHLQFTRIILGWTLDHYCIPGVPSNMKPFSYAVDFHHRKAAIPGDGRQQVSFLHSNDLAKYLAAMLEQDHWPEFSPLASDRMSWGELLALAEEVTQSKWDVVYDSAEALESGNGTVLPQQEGSMQMPAEALQHLWAEFGQMAIRGVMDITKEGLRNDEFPDIKPIKVRETVQIAWGQ